ncbi:MAG: hypothetical protein WCH65_05465 [bacterium]
METLHLQSGTSTTQPFKKQTMDNLITLIEKKLSIWDNQLHEITERNQYQDYCSPIPLVNDFKQQHEITCKKQKLLLSISKNEFLQKLTQK